MNLLDQVKQAILAPNGIQELHIEQVMHNLLSAAVDEADLYFQSSHSDSPFSEIS